jgi:type III protein arginine methyltransferase
MDPRAMGVTGIAKFDELKGNPLSLAMLCTVLKDKGRFDDAFAAGVAAVEAAPSDMEVRDLVAATLSQGVPKWHRPMLHDHARNTAYANALARVIKPGMTVLEIGSGAGLLSLMAARLGAKVYTCEANPMVAAAAKAIARQNGMAERIQVIPKISNLLQVGEDLPQKADVLVSELFDDTFFGDGIIEYIVDAKQRLLQDGALIMDLTPPAKHRPLDSIGNFDLSAFNVLAPRSSSYLRVAKTGASQRSSPVSALCKDFSSTEPYGEDFEEIEFVSSGGRITGIAQWLRIEFSEDNVYENNPFESGESHWGSPISLFPSTLRAEMGEAVRVSLKRVGREIFFKV